MRYQRNSENSQKLSTSFVRYPGAFGPYWRRSLQQGGPGKAGSMTDRDPKSADRPWGMGLLVVNSGTPPEFEQGGDLMMRYRLLGKSGLRVSELFLGAMT